MATAVFMVTWFLFTVLMSVFVKGGFYILLWLFLAPIPAILIVVLFIVANIFILKNKSYDHHYRYYFTRSVAHLVNQFITNIEVEAVGLENVPDEGPVVGFANHKSYIDPFIIVTAIKRPNSFTPKEGLYKIPILRTWIEQMGSMKVSRTDDRETLREMRTAVKRIEEGFFLTVFPEGGRRDRNTDKMVTLLPGAFKLAQKSEATILMMSISRNSKVAVNAPFRKTKVRVTFHKPLKYDDYKDLKTQEIAPIVLTTINSILK